MRKRLVIGTPFWEDHLFVSLTQPSQDKRLDFVQPFAENLNSPAQQNDIQPVCCIFTIYNFLF